MNNKISRLSVLLLTAGISPLAPAEDARKPVEFSIDRAAPSRSNSAGKISSYADVLDKVTPAVVSISTAQVVRQLPRRRMEIDEFTRRFFGITEDDDAADPRLSEKNSKARERKLPLGMGSGFIIHSDGYILTNRHVICTPEGDEADEIVVRLQDSREFKAKVVGSDSKTDIALVKIEGKSLPVAVMADSSLARVGDVVFALGNPLSVGMTVTSGIVSAMGRSELGIIDQGRGFEDFIQTDAAINHGNSGGPLVDAEGRVIGVNTAIVSPNGGGNVGIGFAVPVSIAQHVAGSLANKGKVSRGYFGVQLGEVTRENAEALSFPGLRGAHLFRVEEGSPAAAAGLREGDIVTKVDGRQIFSTGAFRTTVATLTPGSESVVEVFRDGKYETVKVKVGDFEKAASTDDGNLSPISGVRFEPMSDVLRKKFGIPESVRGAVVTSIDADSPLSRRLAVGMVVVRMNRKNVSGPEDLGKHYSKSGRNALQFYYNGGYGYVVF